MLRIPSNRIKRQLHWGSGSAHASCTTRMTGENRVTPRESSIFTTPLQEIVHVDDDAGAGSETSSTPVLLSGSQSAQFLSRVIQVVPLDLSNDVARSSLSHYLELVYRMGMCPHSENGIAYKGRWQKLHKICYSCVVVLSIFHTFRTIKFDSMEFLGKKGHIGRMVGAIFVSIYGFNTMCLMYFLAFKWDVMLESLRSLNLPGSMYLNRSRQQVDQENKVIGRSLFAITIFLVTVLVTSGFYRENSWSVQDFIDFESYYTRTTFTLWRSKNWENGTEEVWTDTWTYTSPAAISLGVLGGIASFCGWLQEHLVMDVMLLLNFALSEHMSRLIAMIQDEHASLDMKWEEYTKMRKLSEEINVAFQYLLPLGHLNNLFLFSYFLLGGFIKTRLVYTVLLGAKVGKILVTYFVASATAFKNKIIQSWILIICEEDEQVTIKGKKKQVPVLLKIAYHDLIGLGYDDFFISQKFLIMFIGTVGTVFLLLVDWHDDKKTIE